MDKEDTDNRINGPINLQHAVMTSNDSDACRFAIDVGHGVYHCKAETQALRDEWVSELNRSIEYFKGLIEQTLSIAKHMSFNNSSPPPPDSKDHKRADLQTSIPNGGDNAIAAQLSSATPPISPVLI